MISAETKYGRQVDFMDSINLKNRVTWLVIALVAFFSLFALWLRLLPMFNMGNTDIISVVASDDPIYNLRQVEFLLANHLSYGWFDPMTLYPVGSDIYWGPLFPIIVAIGCIITGATTRPEIAGVLLIVPPIMAAVLVAVMYFIGKTCGNWKTGVLASGFTAVVTGQFFYRSMYGYADHHIAEVLFSAIFCLFYMYAVLTEKDRNIDLRTFATYKTTILISILAGIAYLFGLFVMPTMILFAMIAGIFTVIQFIIDSWRGKTSEYLLILNATIFIIAIIGLLLFGLKNQGLDLSTYSIGHIYADLGMIGGTVFLYGIQRYFAGKKKYYYPSAIIASAVVFIAFLYVASPQLYTLLVYDIFAFFGQAAVTNTVQEARGWTMDLAWQTFNYGLILLIGGILVMIYNNLRDERPEQVFVITWSVIILFSTWQHVRYEYYLAINIALLSAVIVSFTLERSWPHIRPFLTGSGKPTIHEEAAKPDTREKTPVKGKKQKKTQKSTAAGDTTGYIYVIAIILIAGLGIMFTYTSVTYSYTNANANPTNMNPDWKESMEWLQNNTPETGVDYYTLYNKNTFQYPDEAYGVMSWWDYGHLITTIGKRIPNANPFQQGVAGDVGAAAYFMATSEDTANEILNTDGTRFVVTDVEMDQGKFWAMSTWFNATEATGPYYDTMLLPGENNALSQVILNKQPYYLTMVSRLHNFDGSLTEPTDTYYIVYVDRAITKLNLPVIAEGMVMNISEATQKAAQYNLNAPEGYHAAVYSPSVIAPVDTVPALRQYRLVHESPTNVFNSNTIDLKYVKTFEYVKGAHIPGKGIIEVPIETNTGRTFTYRQASVNGEFIVPYSTTDNPYEVKTTGKYHIIGTEKEFDVPEVSVMQGLTIQ
jgi:dolichyl-diphosphooligosaccharide--protein glycosyltransferase